MSDRIHREDVEAALGVRQEMGREIEPALIDSMTARIEATVRRRYEAEVQHRGRQFAAAKKAQSGRTAAAIISVIMGIPLTAIVAGTGLGLPGLIIVWTGIVLVNVALAMRRPNP